MRGDATFTLDVDFGETSRWGVRRYFEEQLAFFDRWLPDDATGQPRRRGAGADLRDGRRHRPEDRARQARPRRPLARRAGVAARARGADDLPSARRRLAAPSRAPATTSRGASPTTRRTRCRRSAASTARSASFPPDGRGDGADVDAPAEPRAAAAQHHDARALPTRSRREAFFTGARARAAAVRARRRARLPDRAARRAGRGDGPRAR